MRLALQRGFSVVCLLLVAAGSLAQARDSVLSAIPSDALGFVVVHNLAGSSQSIGGITKLVKAPAPDLLSLAKRMTGLQKGLDEQGDLAVVLTGLDPMPKHVILVPVASPTDFFAALQVDEPATGVVEVKLAGRPMLAGQREGYVALARPADRDALEKYLASKTNLANDAPLTAWVNENKVSVVVTSSGIKQLVPTLTTAIRGLQAKLLEMGGEQGKSAADAFNVYLDLLDAAEKEADQFGIGLRIDTAQTIDLVGRVQFTSGGTWAELAASIKAPTKDLLAGLQSGPFIMAMGSVVSPEAMEPLMKFSVKMMQNQPRFKLTPEQAQEYIGIMKGMMGSVHSMGMLMGVAGPGAGLYGDTSVVMTVDNSNRYIDDYEKALAATRAFAQKIKNSDLPVSTTQRISLDDTEVLEASTDLANMKQLGTSSGPEAKKMMELFAGPGGKLKIFVAPADEHTVVMAYTSLDRLKAALDFYKSQQPGLSADPGIAKVAAALPPGSQAVGYISVGGMAKVVQQFATLMPGGRAGAIPDLPDSPPLGMAAKVSATGAEGHLVVSAKTLQTVGEVVAKARGAADGASSPPQ